MAGSSSTTMMRADMGHSLKHKFVLVPKLCLGTHCPRSSASRLSKPLCTLSLAEDCPPSGAWRAVRSQAELGNEDRSILLRHGGADLHLLVEFQFVGVIDRKCLLAVLRRFDRHVPAEQVLRAIFPHIK